MREPASSALLNFPMVRLAVVPERLKVVQLISWRSVPAIFVFAGALLWPIVWVAWHGWTLTGMYEESVGYRYFYTLRALYDPPTLLFLPQGQTTDLIQQLIQIGLTLAGFHPTEIQPRIDYFCYASVLVFHGLNVAAFAWLAGRIRTIGASILSALFWALPFYAVGLSTPYTLLQPDYYAQEASFALLAAGIIVRISQRPGFTRVRAIGLGLFFGAAVGTKITFGLFPAICLGYAVLKSQARMTAVLLPGLICAATAVVLWVLIMLADAGFSVDFAWQNVRQLLAFVRYRGGGVLLPDESWPSWLAGRVWHSNLYPAAIYFTPVFALAALAGSRTRSQLAIAIPLFAAALAESAVLYQRDYAATLIEAGFLFQLIVYLSAWLIWSERLPFLALPIVKYPTSLLAVVAICLWAPSTIVPIAASAGQNSHEQAVLARIREQVPGRQLWIVPDNAIRPLTIDTAIMKGGWNFGWLNPDSPILRSMFPNVDYRFMLRPMFPLDLTQYEAVLFPYAGELDDAVSMLSREYSIPLVQWRCRHVTDVSSQPIAMCRP
jgi:hypothetical protein